VIASTSPRIALIHATAAAVEPIHQAFAADWPQARCSNLLDDSLSADLSVAGQITPALTQRVVDLARHARGAGAQGILFTCSAFGPAIEAAAQALDVPVHKPNEAMFLEALARGGHLLMLSTFAPAVASMVAEFEALRARHRAHSAAGHACTLRCVQVDGALPALLRGDVATHDRLVIEAAHAAGAANAVLLAQFSMARVASVLTERLKVPVLSSPACAVRRLQDAMVRGARR
jgi:Asp/Glu/hydantoin racemase